MSINFGYGGMNMMGNIGVGVQSGQNNENIFRKTKEQYGCEHCFQQGPAPYNYPMYVNPLPQSVTNPSLFRRIIRRIMGG